MKRLSVSLLVLFLVCSCVWAFPKKEASSKSSEVSSQETVEQLWEEVKQSASSSETAQSETSEALSSLLDDLSNSSKLTKQQLSELISKLEGIEADIEVVNADSRAKDEQIAVLLKKAKSVKFFTNFGAVVGFKNAVPTLGAVVNLGVKFGNGIQIGTGAQYQIASFSTDKILDVSWNIDKLSLTTTIGYEW